MGWCYNINKIKKVGINNLIIVKKSLIKNAGKGVFARETIPAFYGDYYFGRFVKEKPVDNEELYTWEVFEVKDNEREYKLGRSLGYVNGFKSIHWTAYVNCSLTENYANVGSFYTKDHNIFYYTKREIQKGEELLVWYGKEYYNQCFKNKDNLAWLK